MGSRRGNSLSSLVLVRDDRDGVYWLFVPGISLPYPSYFLFDVELLSSLLVSVLVSPLSSVLRPCYFVFSYSPETTRYG